MVEFAGFDMPVQYQGVLEEHAAVRQSAGIFDVSHMGEIVVEGPRALETMQRLVTNDLTKCADGQAQYSALCNDRGGVIDDVIVYRFSPRRLLVCVNASGREKDLEWMRAHNMRWLRVLATGHGLGPDRSPHDAPSAVAALQALLSRVEAFNAAHDASQSLYVLVGLFLSLRDVERPLANASCS